MLFSRLPFALLIQLSFVLSPAAAWSASSSKDAGISSQYRNIPKPVLSYIANNLCKGSTKFDPQHGAGGCLAPVQFRVSRKGGRKITRTVFRWKNSPTDKIHVGLHYLRGYLGVITDALEKNTDSKSDLYILVRDQTEYLIQPAFVRSRSGSKVWIDPASLGGVKKGSGQALSQLELINYLLDVARAMDTQFADDRLARQESAEFYLGDMIRFINAFGFSVNTGVGLHTPGYSNCLPKSAAASLAHSCWYFVSRGDLADSKGKLYPRTALNQMAVALRDLVKLYKSLRSYTSKEGHLWPSQLRPESTIRSSIKSWLTSGLYHLAFAPNYSRAHPLDPPSLRGFMDRRSYKSGKSSFYWAFYEFDLSKGRGRPQNKETLYEYCHYHTHTLNVMGQLFMNLDSVDALGGDARIRYASDSLLADTGALYQFLQSWRDNDARFKALNCPGPKDDSETLLSDVAAYYDSKF